MFLNKLTAGYIACIALFTGLISGAVFAQDQDRYVGQPHDKGIKFQEPVTDLAREAQWFHDSLLMPIIVAISAFVLILMIVIVFKFREKKNPKPATFTHNTFLEVAWTVIPIVILVVIAVPSFKLLYMQDEIPETDMVIKVTGNQWNWTYEYPDHDDITFTAVLVPAEAYEGAPNSTYDAATEKLYVDGLIEFLGMPAKLNANLLDTDVRMVVPIDTKVELQITASDVLHAWTVPAFGVKVDAVPGRLNRLWFEVDRLGTYYGQCSELCGKDHAYMPIAVEVVTKEEFAAWVERAKRDYADAGTINYASGSTPVLGR